jgi:hypothetical protein
MKEQLELHRPQKNVVIIHHGPGVTRQKVHIQIMRIWLHIPSDLINPMADDVSSSAKILPRSSYRKCPSRRIEVEEKYISIR